MSLDDLAYAIKEMADNDPDYRKAGETYDGKQGDLFGSTLLEAKLKKDSELYRLNLAKTAVNVVADRLEVAAVTVPSDPKATDLIAKVWADNKLDLYSDSWTRTACKYGDAYVFAWPELADDGIETGVVELALFTPRCMRAIYDPQHPTTIRYVIQRWVETDGTIRVNLIYRKTFERYCAPKGSKEEDPTSWKPYVGDGQDAETENPYDAIPIFHFRTDEPYGVPEHRDAYGAQAAINKAFVVSAASMTMNGFPTLFALQDAEAVMDAATDDPDWDDDTDTVSNTESVTGMGQGSKMRNTPGSINWLAGAKSLQQFAGADPDNFLKPMAAAARMMSQTTDTPMYRLDFSGDKPTGESLKVANLPLNAKVGTRQKWFGATHKDLWAFILVKILKHALAEGAQVEIRWKPPTVVHGKEDWEIAGLKRDAGVPETQTLIEAGYSVDAVKEWQDGNKEAMDLMRRAQILESVGRGAAQLAMAVTAGVLEASAVAALVDKVMEHATPPDPEAGA